MNEKLYLKNLFKYAALEVTEGGFPWKTILSLATCPIKRFSDFRDRANENVDQARTDLGNFPSTKPPTCVSTLKTVESWKRARTSATKLPCAHVTIVEHDKWLRLVVKRVKKTRTHVLQLPTFVSYVYISRAFSSKSSSHHVQHFYVFLLTSSGKNVTDSLVPSN